MEKEKYRALSPFEQWVIEKKGTEKPFSGEYCNTLSPGVYHCKKCDNALYRSQDKFLSHCGWPSFDEEIPGRIKRIPDPDGQRTEIVCARCEGHLGHVFAGEGFTPKNIRHCVNSTSLTLKPAQSLPKALFASGCFWGTEYHFARYPGVIATRVGCAGGNVENPSYEAVCTGSTGHLECCEVIYDPSQTSFEKLCQLFFETHDFTQTDGQGPDVGSQYLSAIFLNNEQELEIAEKVIMELRLKGYAVATQLRPNATFWSAEDYHQKYYFKHGKTPYCHVYRKIF